MLPGLEPVGCHVADRAARHEPTKIAEIDPPEWQSILEIVFYCHVQKILMAGIVSLFQKSEEHCIADQPVYLLIQAPFRTVIPARIIFKALDIVTELIRFIAKDILLNPVSGVELTAKLDPFTWPELQFWAGIHCIVVGLVKTVKTTWLSNGKIRDLVRRGDQRRHRIAQPLAANGVSIHRIIISNIIAAEIGPSVFQVGKYQHMEVSMLAPNKVLRDFDFSISHKFLRLLI